MRATTLSQLNGENAFVILGTVERLLKKLDREVGTALAEAYMTEATDGDYEHLCEVTERYVLQHLRTTLQAEEGDLA